MHDAQIIDRLESKFNSLVGDLDERGRRRWAATEAIALGYGGITSVSLATGLSHVTITNALSERLVANANLLEIIGPNLGVRDSPRGVEYSLVIKLLAGHRIRSTLILG